VGCVATPKRAAVVGASAGGLHADHLGYCPALDRDRWPVGRRGGSVAVAVPARPCGGHGARVGVKPWRAGSWPSWGRDWPGAQELSVSVGDTVVRALACPHLVGTPLVADRAVPRPCPRAGGTARTRATARSGSCRESAL